MGHAGAEKLRRTGFGVSFLFFGIWFIGMLFWGDFRLFARQWPSTLMMIFGSLVGGATCQGGSAIAFPVITKVFRLRPELARGFGFAIQSAGMTAASVFILVRRIPIYPRAVFWGLAAGVPGLLLGDITVVPLFSAEPVRIFFTCLEVTFFISAWYAYRKIEPVDDALALADTGKTARVWLPILCFLGGFFSSLVVTGLDMLLYSTLCLALGAEERRATASCVVVTGGLSVVGAATAVSQHAIPPIVREMWLAAVPVVVFGAPLGALICSKMSRRAMLLTLGFLVLIETGSTLVLMPPSSTNLDAYLFSLLIWLPVYWWLINIGHATRKSSIKHNLELAHGTL